MTEIESTDTDLDLAIKPGEELTFKSCVVCGEYVAVPVRLVEVVTSPVHGRCASEGSGIPIAPAPPQHSYSAQLTVWRNDHPDDPLGKFTVAVDGDQFADNRVLTGLTEAISVKWQEVCKMAGVVESFDDDESEVHDLVEEDQMSWDDVEREGWPPELETKG